MQRRRSIARPALGAAGVVVGSLLVLAWVRPPELLRVAANYTAKTVCSNLLLANRDPDAVLQADVQAPGHPLLKWMRIDVDRPGGVVRAGLFGFIGAGLAVATPDSGCVVLPDGKIDPRLRAAFPQDRGAARPKTTNVTLPELARVVDDDVLAGPGMRAIVIAHDGAIVAERYAAGFDRETRQLGWSMTKSVTAGLVGILIQNGQLALDGSAGLSGGGRERITVAQLLSMTSGLEFNETYGSVSDVTRMLYLKPDMAAFAAAKPLSHPVGAVWSYSSGTAVIVSRVVQEAAGPRAEEFARTQLFEPLGMTSAVLEVDEAGTPVGSSYLYATPRDWARFGQFLAQDGVWQGRRRLPPGYVAMMASPVAASGGQYGHGMVWLPARGDGLPDDTFWMSGHDGQSIAVIPSRKLVIVRMGLTPERDGYHPEPLVRAVLGAVPQGS